MKKIQDILLSFWPFLLGLSIVILFFALPIVGYHLSHFPGDLGDGRFNNYMLEHAHLFFIGIESFWNAPFMYPEPNIITYSDNLVGSAPFYAVFRVFGADRETAFQLWVIMMFSLNYICSYFYLSWQFKSKYTAVIGALVFACSMAIQSQMTHAQTFPRFPIPLAFWMTMLFMKELKPIYLFGAIFMVVYQFYCAIYLGFFLVVPVCFLILFSLYNKRELLSSLIKKINWVGLSIGAIIANIFFLLPLMLPYYQRSKVAGLNSYEQIIETLPTIRSFFYSQSGSLLWSSLTEVGSDYPAFWDHQIFAGGMATISIFIFTIIMMMNIIKKGESKIADINSSHLILFLGMIITFLFFIRYQGFSFYQILYKAPGFGSLRSLTRIINLELIFFAIATTFVFKIVFDKYKKATIPLFLCFTLIFIADNYFKEGASYRTEKGLAQERINLLINKMKNIPKGSIVSYEPQFEGNSVAYQIDAMLAGQSLGLKMINGYSATSPIGYDTYWREISESAREKWLKQNGLATKDIYIIH